MFKESRMALLHTEPGKQRYLIHARNGLAAMAEFLASAERDPDIELIDTIGPEGQVHTAVIEISADKAHALEQRFRDSNQLMIERDRPLSLFD